MPADYPTVYPTVYPLLPQIILTNIASFLPACASSLIAASLKVDHFRRNLFAIHSNGQFHLSLGDIKVEGHSENLKS